ncbi:MAG: STAS domain-containing protein [Candidatus Melainabacteria bacterium]|nr:STAS domain-containing protein [Candidatus Melainabacteria bacterium]
MLAASIGLHFLADASFEVALVGNVPAGLPHIGLPQVEYHAGQGLLVGALGLVIVSFTSGMLTARSMAARAGQTLNPNQEMWAIGAANLAAGLSGSFAITGADSRTAVNFTSGNKTQLSSIFAALATAAVAAWLSVPLAYLPVSALAAVLIFSAAQLMDFSTYKELLKMDPFEFRLSLLTTAGVLALGVLPGVAVAILFALIAILIKIYKPDDTILAQVPGLEGFNDMSLSDEAVTVPGMVIWRFEGPLVFFNADYFKSRAHEVIDAAGPPTHWFVLSLESISQIDATGVKALEDLCRELDAQNVSVVLARPKTFMRKLRRGTSLGDFLSGDRVFPTIVSAVEAIREVKVDDTGRSLLEGSFKSFYDSKPSANGVDKTNEEKA